jgi:hypothetical protein
MRSVLADRACLDSDQLGHGPLQGVSDLFLIKVRFFPDPPELGTKPALLDYRVLPLAHNDLSSCWGTVGLPRGVRTLVTLTYGALKGSIKLYGVRRGAERDPADSDEA